MKPQLPLLPGNTEWIPILDAWGIYRPFNESKGCTSHWHPHEGESATYNVWAVTGCSICGKLPPQEVIDIYLLMGIWKERVK